jgi:hypothetical protein
VVIAVYVSVERQDADLFAAQAYAHCALPFVPAPGDTFYIDSDSGGMTVLRRECTAGDEQATIVVDGAGWSLDELRDAGFVV